MDINDLLIRNRHRDRFFSALNLDSDADPELALYLQHRYGYRKYSGIAVDMKGK